MGSGPTTYYFRARFNWSFLQDNVAFVITNYLSDGAVCYLNGVELNRVRMPAGAVGYGTTASGTNSPAGQAGLLEMPGAPLILGENILEVETHQAPASAADMVFGLSLTAGAQYPIVNLDPAQPADRTINGGDPTTFTASVLGSGPLQYQWRFNGVPIAGAEGAGYTIANVQRENDGIYDVVLTDAVGPLISDPAQLTVLINPRIVDFTTAYTAVEGGSVTMSIGVDGTFPMSYRWRSATGNLKLETINSYSSFYTLYNLVEGGRHEANFLNRCADACAGGSRARIGPGCVQDRRDHVVVGRPRHGRQRDQARI